MQKHILTILVENHFGVLARISGLFARRGFNIEGVAVGITEDPSISRITIVVDGDEYILEQISKQLNKLIEVIKVRQIDPSSMIKRELLLIKVTATTQSRSEIIQIVDIFRGNIVDVSKDILTVELTGDEDKIEAMIEMLKGFGIKEIVRTGTVAIERGNKVIKVGN